jgi:hypothetical protein
VGIVDEAGALCGAGVVLCGGLVLTCAHVLDRLEIGEPAVRIGIEFVGTPRLPNGFAEVRHRVAADENNHTGDIALLQLDQPVPDGVATRPRLMRLNGRHVRAHGYPNGDSHTALWAEAKVVASTGPNDEWMQLVPLSEHSVEVSEGFSGAGVVDCATGEVVGIVVATISAGKRRVPCMIPVETMVRYAPDIESCVDGRPPTDPAFIIADTRTTTLIAANHRTEAGNGVANAVSRLVEALAAGQGRVWNVIGPAEDRTAVLGLLVFLADPTSRRLATQTVAVPAHLKLPAGRIDLAVDARGRSTEEVARRIVERLGLPADEPEVVGRAAAAGAALTMVVDAVDESADPDSLQHELLRAIAAAAPQQGGQLIVGSRQAVLAEPGAALTVGPGRGLPVPRRLDALDAVLAEIGAGARFARERFTHDGAPKFRSAPTVAGPDERLRLRITGLRSASAGREDDPRLPGMLTALERSAARALRQTKLASDQLDAMLATRNELRGRLGAYKARAGETGRAEDPRLNRLYQLAYDHLYTAPCDLTAALAAVDAYVAAMRGPDPAEDG